MIKFLSKIFLVAILFSSAMPQTVSLGITNNNLALVEETRKITVHKGITTVDLSDLPEFLDPTSVLVEFKAPFIRLLEQQFLSEPADTKNILKKFVGGSIRLLHPDLGTIQGELLSFQGETLVIRTAENELRIIPDYTASQLVLEETAEQFQHQFPKPKISWRLDSKSQADTEVKLSYLTAGLGWAADYSAIVDESEENISLASLINIYNHSGRSFYQADLTLIAGELHRAVVPAPYPSARGDRVMEMKAAMDSPFSESESFEYHTFQLANKIDLERFHEKQVPLFAAVSAKTSKSYHYNYQKDPQNVSVFFTIENENKNNLGIPLPEGRIRIYKKEKGQLLILGEDIISNTPKGEILKIEVGKVFDIRAERTVLEQKREGKNAEKVKISVELRNQKKEDVTVLVTEPIFRHRNAKILSSSHKVHRQDAGKIEFLIPAKSGQTEVLIYELIYTW